MCTKLAILWIFGASLWAQTPPAYFISFVQNPAGCVSSTKPEIFAITTATVTRDTSGQIVSGILDSWLLFSLPQPLTISALYIGQDLFPLYPLSIDSGVSTQAPITITNTVGSTRFTFTVPASNATALTTLRQMVDRFPPLTQSLDLVIRAAALPCGEIVGGLSSSQSGIGGLPGQALSSSFTGLYWAGSSPGSVQAADFNGDGIPDLAVASFDTNAWVLLGKGDGTFKAPILLPLAAGSCAVDLAASDLNRDGKPDLVVSAETCKGGGTSVISVFLGYGDGTFQPRLDLLVPYAVSLAVADLNGDRVPDLAFEVGNAIRVYLGNGDGTFTHKEDIPVSGPVTSHLAVADFNGDGKPDLAVNSGTFSVLLGNGDGTFQPAIYTPVGRAGPSADFTVGDFNGDGKLDLAVIKGNGSTQGSVGVLLGNGNGSFLGSVDYSLQWVKTDSVRINNNIAVPFSITSADLNGDGKLDLLVGVYSNVAVLVGDGSGNFSPAGVWGVLPGLARGFALADFNGDGKLDFAVTSSIAETTVEDGLEVLVNTTPSITIGSVLNGASNLAGPIAPGEIVVLKGSAMGPAQLAVASAGPDGLYDPQLAGTTVSFGGKAAPILYTSATQIAAVVPYEVSGTTVPVTVSYGGLTSPTVSVPLASAAPGLFTLNSTGTGQAAALNQDGFTVNGPAAPAHPGDIISLYATGEGQTTPLGVDGKPATAPLPYPNLSVSVSIGGMPAPVQYAGGAPGSVAGLMQINAQISMAAPLGDSLPVIIQIGDASSQPGVTLAVH